MDLSVATFSFNFPFYCSFSPVHFQPSSKQHHIIHIQRNCSVFMERRRSLKHVKGHPLFTQRYQPPIHHTSLNSSGESSGGSSDSRGSGSSVESEGGGVVGGVYGAMEKALEEEPKFAVERGVGRLVGMYRVHGLIGNGNFARVKLGVHQLLRERVAIKIIEKDKGPLLEGKLERMLSREVAALDALSHPNILRLYQVIHTPSRLYLVSEWAMGGDLYALVTLRGRLDEKEARPIFLQIMSALLFMHHNGIVHRDLKAENIFFATSTHCKVGDFGFATLCHKAQLLSTFCGSPPYAAPELFLEECYEGPPVDIWALGILLYFMVEGKLPWTAPSIPLLKTLILSGEFSLSPPTSPQVTSLLTSILQQLPTDRPTLSQILRHPWLRNILKRQDTSTSLFLIPHTPAFKLPSPHQLSHHLLSKEEEEALNLLSRLGIPLDPPSLDKYRAEGASSQVGGIYRIILHRLQQGKEINPRIFLSSGKSEVDADVGLALAKMGMGVVGKSVAPLQPTPRYQEIPQSTTCAIL